MSARDEILHAIRAARPASTPLPEPRVARDESTADLAERFVDAARAGGAHVVRGARDTVAHVVAESGAARVLSEIRDVSGTVARPGDPHALADLDLFVCEGVLGVAENGAVWLPASRLGERAALFLATQVVVVLDRARVVADMHAAYAQLDVGAEPFGVFVAGPSKTADIEQSLVVGAHGPKALTVVLIDSAD